MEKDNVEKLIKKIASVRLKKGLSYENMADDLSLTPAGYRKIETGETKLTVERLFRIAELLETPIAELLEIDNYTMQQNNEPNSVGYQQKVGNYYQENKEIYDKLLKSKDEQIELLKKLVDK